MWTKAWTKIVEGEEWRNKYCYKSSESHCCHCQVDCPKDRKFIFLRSAELILVRRGSGVFNHEVSSFIDGKDFCSLRSGSQWKHYCPESSKSGSISSYKDLNLYSITPFWGWCQRASLLWWGIYNTTQLKVESNVGQNVVSGRPEFYVKRMFCLREIPLSTFLLLVYEIFWAHNKVGVLSHIVAQYLCQPGCLVNCFCLRGIFIWTVVSKDDEKFKDLRTRKLSIAELTESLPWKIPILMITSYVRILHWCLLKDLTFKTVSSLLSRQRTKVVHYFRCSKLHR